MVTIYSTYDKKALAELPVETYEGRIIVILTEKDAEKAVDFLLTQKLLGVDTETRPSFKAGVHNKVALLQVSNGEVCFLFRLNQIGMCDAVKRLLEDTNVPKVGLSWHDDIRQLSGIGEFKPGNFVELQRKVGEIGITDLGLQKVYANLFGKKLSKRQRLTNWEAQFLTEAQKAYASLDALACVRIYNQIESLKESRDYELIVVPVENVQNPIRTPEEKAAARKEKNRKKREIEKAKRRAKREEEKAAKALQDGSDPVKKEKTVRKKTSATKKTSVKKAATTKKTKTAEKAAATKKAAAEKKPTTKKTAPKKPTAKKATRKSTVKKEKTEA